MKITAGFELREIREQLTHSHMLNLVSTLRNVGSNDIWAIV